MRARRLLYSLARFSAADESPTADRAASLAGNGVVVRKARHRSILMPLAKSFAALPRLRGFRMGGLDDYGYAI